jgi:hypothetical protein
MGRQSYIHTNAAAHASRGIAGGSHGDLSVPHDTAQARNFANPPRTNRLTHRRNKLLPSARAA